LPPIKINQEYQGDDKGNKSPTPKIGCQHDNFKGNEANLAKRNGEKILPMHYKSLRAF
jgi:hypothetical protein